MDLDQYIAKPKSKPKKEAITPPKKDPLEGFIASPKNKEVILEEAPDRLQDLGDFGLGVAQGASFGFADEAEAAIKAGLSEEDFMEAYPRLKEEAREKYRKAADRSPWLYGGGNLTGAIAVPGGIIGASAKGTRGIVRAAMEGAVSGAGASEKDLDKGDAIGLATEAAIGGAIGAGSGIAGNLISKGAEKSPEAIRAGVTGASKRSLIDFPGDKRQLLKQAKDQGFFRNRPKEYDVKTRTFKPKKLAVLGDLDARSTEDRLLRDSEDAITKIQKFKESRFSTELNGKSINRGQFKKMIDEATDEYAKRGLIKGPEQRREMADKLYENMNAYLALESSIEPGSNLIPLAELDKIKSLIGQDVKIFERSLGDATDTDELLRIVRRKVKDGINERMSPDFAKYNNDQHMYLTLKGDLEAKLAQLELQASGRPQFEKTNAAESAFDAMMGGGEGKLGYANFRENLEGIVPAPVRRAGAQATTYAPESAYEQFITPAPREMDRTPQGRLDPIIDEATLKVPLPRSMDGIMNNMDFVLKKVQLHSPEMYPAVEEQLRADPESVEEALPAIIQALPHLFQRDKYNRFNNRILDPMSKDKARKDINRSSKLNSIEKAKLINRINSEGVLDDTNF